MTAVAHVQRSGGVRGDVLDENLAAAARPPASVIGRLAKNRPNDFVIGSIREAKVDESRPGEFDGFDQGFDRQAVDDRLTELAWRPAGELGRTQRDVAGEVAMPGVTGPLDTGVQFGELSGTIALGQSTQRVAD